MFLILNFQEKLLFLTTSGRQNVKYLRNNAYDPDICVSYFQFTDRNTLNLVKNVMYCIHSTAFKNVNNLVTLSLKLFYFCLTLGTGLYMSHIVAGLDRSIEPRSVRAGHGVALPLWGNNRKKLRKSLFIKKRNESSSLTS